MFAVPPKIEMLAEVQAGMAEHFDEVNGGFSLGGTKFPSPPNLVFLLHQARNADAETKAAALKMLTATLDKMAQGGLRDHDSRDPCHLVQSAHRSFPH